MNERNDRNDRNAPASEFVDKLIGVRRVAKTNKGGRTMSFGALVVIGDEAGRVGWGKGKAREVPEAVRKATDEAKRAMVRVPLRQGRTIHHEVKGVFGATRVILKPAVPGTGIIAGGPMRAIFEAMGIKDVVAKALGSTNSYNLIQATFAAFEQIETPRGIAAKRGIKVTDLTLHKEEASKGEVDQKELNEEEAAKAAAAKRAKAAAAKKPAQGGKPGARDGKGGDRKPGQGRGDKTAKPEMQMVSKTASLKQAVSATETPAETAPAAEAATEESK
jgi:small subunit ribosomal protein S5